MTAIGCAFAATIGDKELQAIWQDACDLLGQVGIELDHPALLAEFSQHDGITVKDKRVFFRQDLCEKARSEVARDDQNYAMARTSQTRFELRPPFSPFDVIDLESGQKRPATERDVCEGARLYDAFDVVGPAHVHVRDLDPRFAQLTIARMCCQNSRGIGDWAPGYSYEEAIAIRDLYLAAGRKGCCVALQIPHSPLRLDSYLMDILYRARSSENGVRGFTAGGGAMPLPGVSAPIYYRAAAAQGLAECLGAWMAARLVDPALKPYASFAAWAPDLATCKWSTHTPEALLFDVFNRHVMQRLLGLSVYAPIGPLAQMCMAALQGCRIFEPREGHVDNAFSAAHVPIDLERLNYVARFTAGIAFEDEAGLATRIVKEVLPETSFLTHESTLAFRGLYWQPALFTGFGPERLSELLDGNGAELLPQARAIARKKIKEHSFELSSEAARDVERVFKQGVAAIEKARKRTA